MSMEVLRAILGSDVVDRLTKEQVTALANELDAEILRDSELSERLTKVVLAAADKVKDRHPV